MGETDPVRFECKGKSVEGEILQPAPVQADAPMSQEERVKALRAKAELATKTAQQATEEAEWRERSLAEQAERRSRIAGRWGQSVEWLAALPPDLVGVLYEHDAGAIPADLDDLRYQIRRLATITAKLDPSADLAILVDAVVDAAELPETERVTSRRAAALYSRHSAYHRS